MALTKEQIKGLKPGDSLVIHGELWRLDSFGDLVIKTCFTYRDQKREDFNVFSPSCVSLPPDKPKYAPCRRFRAGDEVNVTSRDGRFPVAYPKHTWFGKRATVVEDEDGSGFVQVRSESGHKMGVAFYFLELVSPVEERRPYSVVDGHVYWEVAVKGVKTVAMFSKVHCPNAKAAAEAECKRLNEEWQTKVCRSEDGKEEGDD